jgi:hypothetical protein
MAPTLTSTATVLTVGRKSLRTSDVAFVPCSDMNEILNSPNVCEGLNYSEFPRVDGDADPQTDDGQVG